MSNEMLQAHAAWTRYGCRAGRLVWQIDRSHREHGPDSPEYARAVLAYEVMTTLANEARAAFYAACAAEEPGNRIQYR